MTEKLILQNGTELYTDVSEQPPLASFMLAYFAALRGSGKRVLELCSGNGVVSFWGYDRGFRGDTLLVDRRAEPLELARMTAEKAGFPVHTLCADLTQYRPDRPFDAVLCNPPFFDEEDVCADADRRAVRHEDGLSPDDLFRAAAGDVKERGHVYLCHTPLRLTDVLTAMRANRIEPKKLRFCRHRADSEPFLVLIDGIYRGGRGLSVGPDIIVKKADDTYTEEMMDICERGYV